MSATADSTTGNLVSDGTYLHGVSLADFAITCGNLTGITMWAPVQAECDLGTLANNIDQTLLVDEVYVNSLEFSYSTGANATENYGAETDNKMWLLNAGAFVNYEEPTVTTAMSSFTVASGVAIPILSTGKAAFMRKSAGGDPAITVYDESENESVNYAIKATTGDATYDSATDFGYLAAELDGTLDGPYTISVPTNLTLTTSDRIEIVYAADGYVDAMNTYFTPLATGANADIGALRQGQIEIYVVDGASASSLWRLTGVTLSADLTREPLTELGHLGPYDRPLTLPIPITITVDSTAGDLENWARFSGQLSEFNANTLDDIDLSDLMNKDDLSLIVKVYEQTDEEAGGTGGSRKVNTTSLVGEQQFMDGALQTAYSLGDTEYALKTVVVKNLKITDEGATLDIGANATQTFGFRANNDLFVVKGDLSADKIADLMRNSS